jgi:hypothetical protein
MESHLSRNKKTKQDQQAVCYKLINQYNDQQIQISKPDFSGNCKWECYWQGKKMFNIKDNLFLKQIQDGLLVGSQTILIVNFEVIQEIEDNGRIKEKSEIYNIIKVNEVRNLTYNDNLKF